jgi:3-isopropylmalate/(R)-2-methylmalate dehydratase large subunit
MSIELGSRSGLVAPDDTTFTYLAGRPFAPKGAMWDAALAAWRRLPSDPDSRFDREVAIDCARIAPQVTWGTTPQDVVGVDGSVPDPAAEPDAARRKAMERAIAYLGLAPGRPVEGLSIDVVFIGSCTNSRLSDLEAAAAVARGRKVAPGVRALVVPGSAQVKRAAEAAGLHEVFLAAGFEWREAGCSMCVAVNDDFVAPGARAIATSNRNFEDRQGPKSRTHLASPAMAAAAAVTGAIADVRKLIR